MSHSFTKSANGGKFKSHTTGREYPYAHDRNGKNKRDAMTAMRADEKVYKDAAAARPKAPKQDHASQVISTDHGTKAAQVRHLSSTPNWAKETTTDRQAQLTRDLAGAKSAAAIARIHRRLAATQTAAERGQAKAEAREAAEANRNSDEMKAALDDARATLDSLSMRDDINQSYVDLARDNLNSLIFSGDVAAYRESEQHLTQRYDFEKAARLAVAENELNGMRRDVRGMKAETLLPEGDE